jgi:hypothetical protein
MIFSENRFPLFRIMLEVDSVPRQGPLISQFPLPYLFRTTSRGVFVPKG